MRNISFGQILVLLLICFLLFGDFVSVKKKLIGFVKKSVGFFFKKNRKKGS
jgi:Sec-independent protein translocase protein TatA